MLTINSLPGGHYTKILLVLLALQGNTFVAIVILTVTHSWGGGYFKYLLYRDVPSGFHDFGIRNGVDFHDFGTRNGIDFHDFGIMNGIEFHNFR